MSRSQLRIYTGPTEDPPTVKVTQTENTRETVTVPLADVLPLLADAVRSERTWLADFAHDEITVSMDLYEVLLAYQHYRRPSA